jgi:tetratricopeptide (TPR) repeat protein
MIKLKNEKIKNDPSIYLSNKQINFLLIFSLLLIAIIYLKVFKNNLTNWDDEMYIIDNPFIRSLSFTNIVNIFKSYFAGNYHPLTLISYAINYKMSGLQPWSYQLFNLVLHLVNIFLVFIFIRLILVIRYKNYDRYGLIPVIVAILFGLHTLQVESVAWVSERKNLLYTFLFLFSLICYIRYLKNNSSINYVVSIILFLLSLLSKGTAVTLTICLIGIDYFAGRKILSKRIIIEKIPFLILSIIFGIIALNAQHTGGATIREEYLSIFERIAIASYGFINYLIKLIYPYNLSAFYPYPVKLGQPLPVYYYLYTLIPLLIILILWKFFRQNKIIIFGSLFYITNIVLVLQIIPVGDAVMADRYVYLPSIGFFFIASYYLNEILYKYSKYQIPVLLVFIAYCYIVGIKTYIRIDVWRSSMTLWNDAIKKYPKNNDRGYLNRGNIYYLKGNYIDALNDYNTLLSIDSTNSGGYIGRALIKQAMNEFAGALEDYNKALSLRKTYEGYLNRAALRMHLNDFDNAWNDLDSAYSMNNLRAGVHINKGIILYEKEKYNEAIEYFNIAIKKEPRNYKPFIGRGKTKQALNDYKGAMEDFNTSLSLVKSFEGYLNRANLKISMKDYDGAKNDLNNAILINPNNSEIYINYGIIEIEQNNFKKAIEALNKAIELNQNNYKAYMYLGIAYYKQNEIKEAIEYFNQSIALKTDKLTYYYRGLAYVKNNKKITGCNDLKQSFILGYDKAKAEIEKNCK